MTYMLDHLDFKPGCTETGCPYFATYALILHNVDWCGDTDDDAVLLCDACQRETLRAAARLVGRRRACTTCGAPLAELSDVVRSVLVL
jgi:hypothetical protein